MGLIDSVIEGQREAGRIRAAGYRNQAQTYGNLFSNIAQTIGSIPAQIQQREQTAQQNELNSLRLQEGRGELADKEKARQKQAAVENVLSQHPNIEDALPELYKIDPRMAADIAKHVSDAKKDADQERQRQEGYIAAKLGGPKDQGTWTKTLFTLKRAFPNEDWSGFSDDYEQSKPAIAARLRGAMSPKEQSDADFKTADDARQAKTADETARHNAAIEAVTASNTLTDNERARKVAEETARHNKAMEGTALIRARRPSGGAGGTGGEKLTPDAVEKIATAYNLLGIPAIPTRLSDSEKIPILNEAAKQDKAVGRSPAQAVTRQLATKADGASLVQLGKLSSSAEAFESKAVGQADIISDLSSKVSRTKWPIINAAIQSGRENITGDADATKLANAITTFSAEYAKIMEGSTGSVAGSSDASRRAAERLINTSMSKGTMQAVLDLMKREMRLTIQGYDVAKTHITDRVGGAPSTPAATPKYRYNPATQKYEPY